MAFDAGGFGQRLRQYRIKNHLTQDELAERIDTATSSISHSENSPYRYSSSFVISL